MSVAAERLDEILKISDEVPYNAQYFCHALWIIKESRGEVLQEDIHRAIQHILLAEGHYYGALWEQLSLHQRRTARALARTPGASPFAAPFLREHDLGPSASVARSLSQLMKREIMKKADGAYRFADPFFRTWILSAIP